MRKNWLTIGLMTAFLVACGGSDGESPRDPAGSAAPEGFWVGKASTGVDVNLVVLEDGSTWGVYTNGVSALGALKGKTVAQGDRLSGSGKEFDLVDWEIYSSDYTGTFSSKESISVTLDDGTTFDGSYDNSYDQPASLGELAGTFGGYGATASGWDYVYVNISDSGEITSELPGEGCSMSGQATPHGDKGVFDLSVTFRGTGCSSANGATGTGIVYYNVDEDVLIALALNSGETDGLIYVAEKNTPR